ncbi:MAG TPA: diacylglycerol kinase family protein [Acidobacteriota bacterium]|nr:diacylglycerol kinase family protein [Acidobacteriota bacterium]
MRLSIIVNPVAGGGRALKKIRHYIRHWTHPDWKVELMLTSRSNHAGELAAGLLDRPPDLLAVCGGDGTFNEVASGLSDPPFPLAILPGGTANVLARELGIPLDPVKALLIALRGKVRQVDLGEFGRESARKFILFTGIGFDAAAVCRVNPSLKDRLGMGAYVFAIIKCLHSYPFPEFSVTAGSKRFIATSCLACNARSYGGGLLFCPDADMEDGLLDVLVVEGIHRLGLASLLFHAWLGRAKNPEWVHRFRAKEIIIEGERSIPAQIDGEFLGVLPSRIGFAGNRFPLIVP